MSKTNYTKMEEALNEGLLKMSVSRLLDLTNAALDLDQAHSIGQLLALLNHEMKILKNHGIDPYEKLGIDKKTLKKLIDNPNHLTAQDFEQIKKLKGKIEEFKKEIESKLPQVTDDELVSKERRKHINKRFNVNEKWLPLH